MKRGRKLGYKHSPETIEKIRQSRLGLKQPEDTRQKISESLRDVPKTEEHRDSMSEGHIDLERKCLNRFFDLRDDYPGFEEFFDNNFADLVYAMQDIKSEKELEDICRYIESVSLQDAHPEDLVYHYSSSSCYAHEDIMISLIDAKSFLAKKTSHLLVN